jgi:hypothetical protein
MGASQEDRIDASSCSSRPRSHVIVGDGSLTRVLQAVRCVLATDHRRHGVQGTRSPSLDGHSPRSSWTAIGNASLCLTSNA